jgi:hypothetical protein
MGGHLSDNVDQAQVLLGEHFLSICIPVMAIAFVLSDPRVRSESLVGVKPSAPRRLLRCFAIEIRAPPPTSSTPGELPERPHPLP